MAQRSVNHSAASTRGSGGKWGGGFNIASPDKPEESANILWIWHSGGIEAGEKLILAGNKLDVLMGREVC